ncbi:FAD-binding oxidoreductase [Marinomonas transparens]|uniref:D-lactate dehydrogenase (cytochrome) n=1 Tax=Marinomonas transparens TaxID=2795388 RepID=A0A934N7J5_9GAMM|nr:FAD-linked oxidase C-terminal domain-containing protein [Marinomonas transparens]MBJ7539126.1 FAD-binding protein [Marinomonas transparens]
MAISENITRAIEELSQIFGDRLHTSQSVRSHHGQDESWHEGALPDAVLMAHETEDVVKAVKICATYQMPIVAFGAGSSVEGQVIPTQGGLCINFTEMNKVLEIRSEDFDVSVQPGVTRKQLNMELRHQGLMFPVDPGANATIGGMTATRASGTTSVRYGTMEDNVVSLTVVTADGRVIKTAQRARKSSAGYDLTHLFVGSEGTLGIITEITLRLYPIPEAISSAVASFPDMESAINAVITTLMYGVPIARIELLDGLTIEAVNTYLKSTHAVKPTLFLEFHGSEVSVKEQAETVGGICAEFDSADFIWKTLEEDRNALWEARHNGALAVMAMRPGAELLATDVCVPISRLAEMIEKSQQYLEDDGIYGPLMGHVGDGNFHFVIPVDRTNTEEFAKIKAFCARLAADAIAMDGTCTGEHGIGLGKQSLLTEELGECVDYMRLIKQSFDPNNIMNPGKIFSLTAS